MPESPQTSPVHGARAKDKFSTNARKISPGKRRDLEELEALRVQVQQLQNKLAEAQAKNQLNATRAAQVMQYPVASP